MTIAITGYHHHSHSRSDQHHKLDLHSLQNHHQSRTLASTHRIHHNLLHNHHHIHLERYNLLDKFHRFHHHYMNHHHRLDPHRLDSYSRNNPSCNRIQVWHNQCHIHPRLYHSIHCRKV